MGSVLFRLRVSPSGSRERADTPLSRASIVTNVLTSGCYTGGPTCLCLRGPSVRSDL